MDFVTFEKKHMEEAMKIAWDNYLEEREFVPELPKDASLQSLDYFAENGLGVAALENGKMLGYMCVYEPWSGAFDTQDSLGTFSPLHGNGAVKENRYRIYQNLYAEIGKRLAGKDVKGLGVCLYAHDEVSKKALFEYGFGMRCKDAIREIGKPDLCEIKNPDVTFEELDVADFSIIRGLRHDLHEHLKEAPCFMQADEKDFERWISKVETGDRRTFLARVDGKPAAYFDISDEAENFVTEHPKMSNICGAYCKPEHRGRGINDDLLIYVLAILKAEGYDYLGVDYESYNPTANRYWAKHFKEYTNSVTRKIELWCKHYDVVQH